MPEGGEAKRQRVAEVGETVAQDMAIAQDDGQAAEVTAAPPLEASPARDIDRAKTQKYSFEDPDPISVPVEAKADMKDAGTCTPPVLMMAVPPKMAKKETSPVIDTGKRKPKRPKPQQIMVAPPLVRYRATTEEEWEVEDTLEVSILNYPPSHFPTFILLHY